MIFWLIVLTMLVAAILCVLWPMSRSPKNAVADNHTLDVYIKQLSDLDKREASTPDEAETISQDKAEVSRRILKENSRLETARQSSAPSKLGTAIAISSALIVIPGICAALYGSAGSPHLPDSPLVSAKLDNLEGRSIEQMVQIAERHLSKNPDDIKGWKLLADVYGRLNRPSDRARALEQVIRLSEPTPALLSELGEALTVADDNIVSQRAKLLFEKALEQDKTILKASVYLALALEQEGRYLKALARWKQLATNNRDDANWQAMVSQRIAIITDKSSSGEQNGPSRQDIEEASKMTTGDRLEMINSMVVGLAEKLEAEPNNINGWLRLIRSYTVLNRQDEAAASLRKARQQFKAVPENIAKLDGLAQQLGLPNNE